MTKRSSHALRWTAIAASLAMMALALIGFGNALASGGPTATASSTKTVSIKGLSYLPATARVKPGTKVTFSNKDSALHTATGKGFDTGTIGFGKSKTITFRRKGTFAYHCTLHAGMRGKVIVG